MTKAAYTVIQISGSGFEETEKAIRESLKNEDFGIITEINVQEIIKNKLNIDYSKYIILGACNPKFAHRALLSEPEIGALLPCNVVVFEDSGEVKVGFMKPTSVLGFSDNEQIKEIAGVIETKLSAALEKAIAKLNQKV